MPERSSTVLVPRTYRIACTGMLYKGCVVQSPLRLKAEN